MSHHIFHWVQADTKNQKIRRVDSLLVRHEQIGMFPNDGGALALTIRQRWVAAAAEAQHHMIGDDGNTKCDTLLLTM